MTDTINWILVNRYYSDFTSLSKFINLNIFFYVHIYVCFNISIPDTQKVKH